MKKGEQAATFQIPPADPIANTSYIVPLDAQEITICSNDCFPCCSRVYCGVRREKPIEFLLVYRASVAVFFWTLIPVCFRFWTGGIYCAYYIRFGVSSHCWRQACFLFDSGRILNQFSAIQGHFIILQENSKRIRD